MAENADVPQAGGDAGSRFDLGVVSKFGVASGALAYATGTLTINIYLHQLGITDFSLAKPKLIVTGILVLLSFVILVPLPVFVARRIWGPRGQGKGIFFGLLFPLLLLIAASIYLCWKENPGLGQSAVWAVWRLIEPRNHFTRGLASLIVDFEVYVPICLAGVSAFAASRLLYRPHGESKVDIHAEKIVYFLFLTALAVGSIIGYIYVFSITFYPAVSPEFGGGKPYFESFVIAEDGRCEMQQFGMPFRDKQPNVTKFLPVLHESDVLVAVWLDRNDEKNDNPDNRHSVVVKLDKTQIIASMTDPREKNVPKLVWPPLPCASSSNSSEALGRAR